MINKILNIFFLVLCSFYASANNVKITDIELFNDSTLNFSISWENSWKVKYAPGNHDAVWIFIKKRDCASLTWSHVDLSVNASDHEVGSPLEVYIDGKDLGDYAKGVFIRRANFGSGNIVNVPVSIAMRGEVNGEFDFEIHGIEMVYIPQSSYYLGDGVTTVGGFYRGGVTPLGTPFLVESEDPLAISPTSLIAQANIVQGTLPQKYPKGYAAIYCMKYELTQGQWVKFLNSLTNDQAQARYLTFNSARVNVVGTWPNITTSFPHRAMANLSYIDLMAYLDWSALRLMTELEYEKICKGPVAPVLNGFAWGNNSISTFNTGGIVNDGTASERLNDSLPTIIGGVGNYGNMVLGVMRVGFASGPSSNRIRSGASYYGVMDMSGNVNEITVYVSYFRYDGIVGDGKLTNSPLPGLSDVPNWPSTPGHKMQRGGGYSNGIVNLYVRTRTPSTYYWDSTLKSPEDGGRGVR